MRSTIQDVMTRGLVVARPSTPLKQVARLLADNRIAALPVIDQDGRPLGVVSETDLARQMTVSPMDAGATAADVMTTPAATIDPTAKVAEAARQLQDRKVRRLLVVDQGGMLAGIVTRTDLLRVFLRPDEFIRFELIDKVAGRLPGLLPRSLQIDVTDGRVILNGEVEDADAVTVRELACAVDGVIDVEDHLRVLPGVRDDLKVGLD